MFKVAIIIPTMNRPEFVFRQLKFYELMKSPHPVYLSDSSNEENAKKLQEGIKEFKNFNITYQWVPPGKDCLYKLLPLVREKYCMQMGDDDIMIPSTISECAEFLELHPDYGTCAGKQVNIRFRKEDYNKPYGVIEKYTPLTSGSLEQDNIFERSKDFWTRKNMPYICFAVRRLEIEKEIRDITKNFSLVEDMTEFLLLSSLVASGKFKLVNRLGYFMQISDNRTFNHALINDFLSFPPIMEYWKICEKALTRIIMEKGNTRETSLKIVKEMFIIYLALPYLDSWLSSPDSRVVNLAKGSYIKQAKYFILNQPAFSKIYFRLKSFRSEIGLKSENYNSLRIRNFLEGR